MPASLRSDEIKRIVVRGTSWVGDAVMTLPALRELRRILPQAHITLATRAWAEGIFAEVDCIDDLLIEEQPKGLGATWRQTLAWRRGHYDLAVLFSNSFQAALVAFAARVPRRIGYATDGRSFLLTHHTPVPAWRKKRHEVFYYLHLIRALEGWLMQRDRDIKSDVEIDSNIAAPRYELRISTMRRTEAQRLLQRHGITLSKPFVVLCPGSTNSRAKRWPAASYAALADSLIADARADVAIIGAREEMDVTKQVLAQMRGAPPVVLTGQTELNMTTAVLSHADLVITNDTGPAHIAAALDRPTLVIFGPTDPVQTRPFSPSAEIIIDPPACAPCMLRDCPIDHRCLTAITPSQVLERAYALLSRASDRQHEVVG